MRACGRTAGGQGAEQRVCVGAAESEGLKLRRIRLQLDEPTRNGETTVYLLTRWPGEAASAAVEAELYLTRWTIETAFLRLTVELRCEIDALSYPRAVLFALCRGCGGVQCPGGGQSGVASGPWGGGDRTACVQ